MRDVLKPLRLTQVPVFQDWNPQYTWRFSCPWQSSRGGITVGYFFFDFFSIFCIWVVIFCTILKIRVRSRGGLRYVSTYIHYTHTLCIYIYIYRHIYIYIYIYITSNVCTVCTVCNNIWIYTHIHIYTHTYTHTHTHTHTRARDRRDVLLQGLRQLHCDVWPRRWWCTQ